MGYCVHITRRKLWSDSGGSSITEQEWLAHVGGDSDLDSLRWGNGNIETKNPDLALIKKMASVAAALGATVQGDDGESYDDAGNPVQPPQPGVFSRVAAWLADQMSPGAKPVELSSLPFKVGDRVRDTWGNMGRVTGIDVRAEHGLGRITVSYEDGRTLSSAAVAHGLERADA